MASFWRHCNSTWSFPNSRIMNYTILLLSTIAFLKSSAQTPAPFDSSHWQISAREATLTEYRGKQCLKLNNGTAVLKNVNFLNGVIEFDIALEQAYYFPGIAFRVKDNKNAEYFYLRPHLSGKPDAMQYYPEYNYSGGWQLYYGDGFTAAHDLPMDRWLHIKMLIKGSEAEVYFDDEKDPVLFINKLLRPMQAGMLTLDNTMPATAWFANFSYTATDQVILKSKSRSSPPLPGTVFTSWEVSDPFEEKLISDRATLSPTNTAALNWHHLLTDDRGIADLSILSGIEQNKNTVFAKLIIESEKAQLKKLSFGFSDRARLYFNNRLLYAGQDNFLSRDYRFLGTMGYYDAVYLDLKKGKNEVWIAVSENEGGWGVMAKLEDLSSAP
jgi:hypothetical protein